MVVDSRAWESECGLARRFGSRRLGISWIGEHAFCFASGARDQLELVWEVGEGVAPSVRLRLAVENGQTMVVGVLHEVPEDGVCGPSFLLSPELRSCMFQFSCCLFQANVRWTGSW